MKNGLGKLLTTGSLVAVLAGTACGDHAPSSTYDLNAPVLPQGYRIVTDSKDIPARDGRAVTEDSMGYSITQLISGSDKRVGDEFTRLSLYYRNRKFDNSTVIYLEDFKINKDGKEVTNGFGELFTDLESDGRVDRSAVGWPHGGNFLIFPQRREEFYLYNNSDFVRKQGLESKAKGLDQKNLGLLLQLDALEKIPVQSTSVHQQLNPQMYSAKGFLRPRYAPKELGL